MLAVSSGALRRRDEGQGEVEMESFSAGDFADVLESIDFDDLFDAADDGNVLPDLEMDPEMFADLSDLTSSVGAVAKRDQHGQGKAAPSDSGGTSASTSRGDEINVTQSDQSVVLNPSPTKEPDNRSGRKSKNHPQGKKKVKKVDWTPELHRRFVQAVEQLGVDKAVPSRILELMGIDCLTRHNIASHLQKYRSHRKHLLAREAEAANWSQRRQQLFGVAGGGGGGGGGKRDVMSPWLAPTIIGFPPMTPVPPPQPTHHFRPLHVWGHPTMDQSFVHMWPKPSPTPQPWPAPPSSDPSYWHQAQHQHQRGPNALTPGTPCFPRPLTTRFGSPTVAGIPPPPPHAAMYKVDPGIGVPARQPPPRPLFDFHPSKESVDAAIGDVLSKPWLPLPLGLKAPALDSVMGELQRQGIPKVPPSCA